MLMTNCAQLIDKTLYLLTLIVILFFMLGFNTELMLKQNVCHTVVHESLVGDQDHMLIRSSRIQIQIACSAFEAYD